MATYLVTGCAGFIASKVSEFLLAEGHTPLTTLPSASLGTPFGRRTGVVGVDNLNDAYDVRLKAWRMGVGLCR